jgi:hypothetical protein
MLSRTLAGPLAARTGPFPAVFLTGPRQSGKTTLARATFPDFAYVSLEDLANRREAVDDPRGFLTRHATRGVILDEIQRAPELFSAIQGAIDDGRGGPFLLTGSQQFLLSERISQSLAGRVAILELLPFSIAELLGRPARAPDRIAEPRSPGAPPPMSLHELLFTGTFPRIHDRRLEPAAWLDGYVRTYVERDVRTVAGVGDLDRFARFVGLCAGRAGQILNASSLGSDAGVSHTTAASWLSVLRASYIVDLVPPHHENFGKRLIKSPKLYFVDTGLLCHLLGIRHAEDLSRHPLRGAIFENFVFSEFRKVFLHHGQRPPLTFWRDRHGHEVDLLVDLGTRRVPVEIKSGATVASDFVDGLARFAELAGIGDGVLVYGGAEASSRRGFEVRPWFDCS